MPHSRAHVNSARGTSPSKLAGLETGADDYLVKPFNTTELAVRMHNLIEQRRRLREKFSKEMVLQPQHISLATRDATFLTNLLSLVRKIMRTRVHRGRAIKKK